MTELLKTGVSALTAFKRGLATTGHNIANVNTEGYSRQTVELGAREPQRVGAGFVGTGVEVDAIRRKYDDFLAERYRTYTAASEQYGVQSDRISLIDNLLADPDSGLAEPMQQYFDAMQDVATDPTSIPARQVALNQADQLAARFSSLNGWLNDLNGEVNADLENTASEVTSLANAIALVNGRIVEASNTGAEPNDLLDDRDRLLDQLSELTNLSTVEQDNGALNVFLGNGAGLVIDNRASALRVVVDPNAPGDQRKLQLVPPSGVAVDLKAQSVGGKIGGLVAFRDEVLDPTRDDLGRLAVAMARETNGLQTSGMDLDGGTGSALFTLTDPSDSVSTSGGAATVDLSYVDTAALEATEYRLDYSTADGWAITPANTGVRQVLGTGSSFTVDGLQIDISGTSPNDGDSYRLQPFRQAASGLAVALTDPRGIAAADASAAPDGFGDNSNALAMAQLQSDATMNGGKATFADAYGELVADVGTRAREAQDSAAVQSDLATQTEASRQEVSGVNLDEEAANLLKYQQAYQAAAQVIAVANTLFDSLLGAVQR